MKEVPLTRGYVALVDDEDYERVMQFRWQAKPCCHTVYATRTVWLSREKSTSVTMHRFIMGDACTGRPIDHIDHNGLNNTHTNLRVCTAVENIRNMRPRGGKSQFKGVTWDAKKRLWRARISFGGKRVGLGRYKDETKASLAYDRAALQHFGDFALPNLIAGRL